MCARPGGAVMKGARLAVRMSLFRRFRREKESEPTTEPSESDENPSPEVEATPEPAEPTVPAGETPSEPTPPMPSGPQIPPPLPDRPAAPVPPLSVPSPDALSKCFICGSVLTGRTCPTCRMTWVE